MTTAPETANSILKIENDVGVALLTLARPHRLNAFSGLLRTALRAALDTILIDDEIRVVVITGGPRSDGRPCFSAGADLKDLADGGSASIGERDPDLVREVAGLFEGDHLGATGFRATLQLLATFPKPVIAAIDGVCTGGGLELALSCDIRVASETAQISDLHMKQMAHTGGAGATSRLARLVGPSTAKEMIFLGMVLDGKSALQRGLVNRVTAPQDLLTTAMDIAREIAQRHPIALRVGKALANAAVDLSHMESLRHDYLCWTAQMMTTGDFDGAKKFVSNS